MFSWVRVQETVAEKQRNELQVNPSNYKQKLQFDYSITFTLNCIHLETYKNHQQLFATANQFPKKIFT